MKTAPSVKFNILYNFLGKGWANVLNLIFIPFYVKLMGASVFGLIGFYLSMVALLSWLDMGLSSTLSRELSRLSAVSHSSDESRNLVRTFEVVYWAIGLAIGLIVAAASPLIASHWIQLGGVDASTARWAIAVMGLCIACQWPASMYTGGLMGLQQQAVLNVIRSVLATFQHGGALLLLLYVSPTAMVFFLWQSLIAFVTTLVLAIWLWKMLPSSSTRAVFDRAILIKNSRFATGMTGITLVTIVLTQLDKIILSKMLTLEWFGYYMLAFNVANALQNLVTPIFSAVYPKFTQLATTGEEVKLASVYHRSCQLLAVLVLPTAVTIAFFSKELLNLWLGHTEAAIHAYPVLTWLIIGTALNAVMTLPYSLQLSYGWTQLAFRSNVLAVVILVPLMVVMVKMHQGVGAAWVWILLNLSYVLFQIPVMHRRLLKQEMTAWYLGDFLKPLAASFVVAFFARVLLPSPLSIFGTLISLGSVFAFSFLASFWLCDRLDWRSLKSG